MKKYFTESLKYLIRCPWAIQKEINEVKHLYSLNEEALTRYKEDKFLNLFQKAYKLSPFYSEFYGKHGVISGDIKSLKDISRLPILTKDMVKNNHSKILIDSKWKVKKANTSGTTGTPLTVYHSYKAIRMEQAFVCVHREKCGFYHGDKIASLRGNLNRSQFKMFIPLSNTLYLSSYQLKSNNAFQYYKDLLDFKPKAIEGYPSSLYNLCLLLNEFNLRLNIPISFTSSETLFPYQREFIERILNTKIYDHYGCTERTVFLSETMAYHAYKEAPGYSINEFKDDHIITTSLINESFPLINYQVNDVVDKNDKNEIISIAGRKEDILLCKDHSRIGRIDHIFKDLSGIKLAQIVQHDIGKITINIVPDIKFNDKTLEVISFNAEERFGKGNMDIHLKKITKSDIILTEMGKFNLVKSYVRIE